MVVCVQESNTLSYSTDNRENLLLEVHTSLTAGYFLLASLESRLRSPLRVCTSCLSLAASPSLSLVCRTPVPLPVAILSRAKNLWNQQRAWWWNGGCSDNRDFQIMRTTTPTFLTSRAVLLAKVRRGMASTLARFGRLFLGHSARVSEVISCVNSLTSMPIVDCRGAQSTRTLYLYTNYS